MLLHHASEVFHQQHNDLDIVTVHIKSLEPSSSPETADG